MQSATLIGNQVVQMRQASEKCQTPPDLVVKFQPLDIVGFIL
jgi:hypothetical protein